MVSEHQETNTSVPMMVEPITTVLPRKVKRKSPTNSSPKKKKHDKSNVGTPVTTLCMVDQATSFVTTAVKPNVEPCVKDANSIDAEGFLKTTSSSEDDEGNYNASLIFDIPVSSEKLGLENLSVINRTVSIDMDPSNDGKVANFNVPAQEHGDMNVEGNGETSLNKFDNHEYTATTGENKNSGSETTSAEEVNSEKMIVSVHSKGNEESRGKTKESLANNESSQETHSDKRVPSEHSAEKLSPEKEEHSRIEVIPEKDICANKVNEDLVNIDDRVYGDISTAKREVERVAKRLRSNKRKVVYHEDETPKFKNKTAGIDCKKIWSKVKVKSTATRSRKRKVASSDESDYYVGEDVSGINVSASKRFTEMKVVKTVTNVPIDKASFHFPENALRWKYIFHRRLALERELGKEAMEMEQVMSMIKEVGLLKTVCNIGNCFILVFRVSNID